MTHEPSQLLDLFRWGIVLSYGVFVLQIVMQTNWRRLKRGPFVAIGSLVAVFLLCAASGYLSAALGMSLTAREWFHGGLVLASLTLILTNQGRVIAALLSEDQP